MTTNARTARTASWWLRLAGFTVGAVLFGFVALFLVGETLSDPGGWRAVGLLSSWLVPLVAGLILVRRRPLLADRILAGATGAVIAIGVWFAIASEQWRSLENHVGPVRAVVVFVLAVILVVHGLKRTARAGILLLVLGIGSAAIATVNSHGLASLTAVCAPAVVTGLLYVASSLFEPSGRPHGGPSTLPVAASSRRSSNHESGVGSIGGGSARG